jgi:uncharacterized protein YndB with AHSA1/START domain
MSNSTIQFGEFTVERLFDAPVSRVYSMFADQQAKELWFKSPSSDIKHTMDFSVGGEEYNSGTFPDGMKHIFKAYYYDIVPEERIVYTYEMFMDLDRISVSLATIEFFKEGDKTRLVLHESGAFLDGIDSPEVRAQGSSWLMDAIEQALKNYHKEESATSFSIDKDALTVTASRIFSATPERLWRALTEDSQIAQWWGPSQYICEVEKNDVRVDGVWRIIQRADDGPEHAFRGKYVEVSPHYKIVRTFEYEPEVGHIHAETMQIEPLSNTSSKLIATARYENLTDLEGMVGAGMESGEREGFERLALLVQN